MVEIKIYTSSGKSTDIQVVDFRTDNTPLSYDPSTRQDVNEEVKSSLEHIRRRKLGSKRSSDEDDFKLGLWI